jgi:hypothetical protein
MATRDEMLSAIGDAIQTYALLEFKLFQLARSLLGVEPDAAAAVFYSVRNSRDRNTILKQLLGISFGNQYDAFWKSMGGLVSQLDSRRNQIVHGLLVVNDGADPPEQVLTRPESYWVEGWPIGQVLGHAEVLAFINKTRVVSELIQHFVWYESGGGAKPRMGEKWAAVFARAVAYPLPGDHPLNK